MSDLFVPVDGADRLLALTARGLLAEFNTAGVVTAADVHVAQTLGLVVGEHDESVLLAVALTSRAVRTGSVCLDLSEVDREVAPDLPWPEETVWRDAVVGSRLVEGGVVTVTGTLVYLDRYHQQETQVLDDLVARAGSQPPFDADLLGQTLDRIYAEPGFEEQRSACERAAQQWTTVITGGPGTGKTTTVARLLVTLHEQFAAHGDRIRVALTAPTGKAAARLQESLAHATLGAEDKARIADVEAMTIHRLLGSRPGSATRFRHDRSNRLPHDVVVVDETSMVSLTLMARLLEALRPDARLVLVGDPHQLSSVEAGAVLSDIVRGFAGRPDSPVAELSTTHRYGAEIGALAEAIKAGAADEAIDLLTTGGKGVRWVRDAQDPAVRNSLVTSALALRGASAAAVSEDEPGRKALERLEAHRLLCAHRDGPFGVRHWNRRVEQWITAETSDLLHERSYLGRPVMVTANDYVLGIYNGDSGVVVETADGRRVALAGTDGAPRLLSTARLGDIETMHALTIHKSQGSQARHVTVLLPDEESRLLTRELFYTAVTRASEQVTVVGEEGWVRAAIERRAQRASGLAERLAAGGLPTHLPTT